MLTGARLQTSRLHKRRSRFLLRNFVPFRHGDVSNPIPRVTSRLPTSIRIADVSSAPLRIADVSSAQATKSLSFTELRSVSTRGRVESYSTRDIEIADVHQDCRRLVCASQDCRRLVCTSDEVVFFCGTSFRFDTRTCRILSTRNDARSCPRLWLFFGSCLSHNRLFA